MHYFVEKS